jgi:phosphoribosyl-ATP pyrophosphohydrolase/phosphoribosyl-AMP cyclohydrolase
MRNRNAPLSAADLDACDWAKGDGLIPAVVQDAETLQVLMLGYVDRDALAATLADGLVTFFSRSRGVQWRKGETSGNTLLLRAAYLDCDNDTVLMLAEPQGPTCHLGTASCFTEDGVGGVGALGRLARTVRARAEAGEADSYTVKLLQAGIGRVAQKVGEEGVEVALAAVTRDADGCAEEVADLVYHLTVLMQARGFGWDEVAARLAERAR